MIYGSVCSGIEAASVAWHPLGWTPSFFAEIEPFPRAVLAHHYPSVPLHGDFTTIRAGDYAAIDVLVGGTPCQSFSVAGLRRGLDDDRGNLALEYLRLADRLRPRWLVWENVSGVLSSGGGRDFGAFVGGLVECGYGFAYRVLDAQYFGLAQRRKRVFVVGYLGDWRPAVAALFPFFDGLRGNPAPSRETRQTAPTIHSRSTAGGGLGTDFDCDGGLVHAFDARQSDVIQYGDMSGPLDTDGHSIGVAQPVSVAFTQNQRDEVRELSVAGALAAEPGAKQQTYLAVAPSRTAVAFDTYNQAANAHTSQTIKSPQGAVQESVGTVLQAMKVRRITPVECERLQGFPDGYTAIPWRGKPASDCPDGPRYKALGNSMAVPVMHWIGRNIERVERAAQERAA